MFEPVHGSAPDLAGKGLANPLAAVLSGVLMLEYLGEHAAGDRIRDAVYKVLEDGKIRTVDLGGKSSTNEFTRAIIEIL